MYMHGRRGAQKKHTHTRNHKRVEKIFICLYSNILNLPPGHRAMRSHHPETFLTDQGFQRSPLPVSFLVPVRVGPSWVLLRFPLTKMPERNKAPKSRLSQEKQEWSVNLPAKETTFHLRRHFVTPATNDWVGKKRTC